MFDREGCEGREVNGQDMAEALKALESLLGAQEALAEMKESRVELNREDMFDILADKGIWERMQDKPDLIDSMDFREVFMEAAEHFQDWQENMFGAGDCGGHPVEEVDSWSAVWKEWTSWQAELTAHIAFWMQAGLKSSFVLSDRSTALAIQEKFSIPHFQMTFGAILASLDQIGMKIVWKDD